MLLFDPSLLDPQWDGGEFEQIRRFLNWRGADAGKYWVGSVRQNPEQADAQKAWFKVVYDAEKYRNGGRSSVVSWHADPDEFTVRTDLRRALSLLSFAFDDPGNFAMLTTPVLGGDPASIAATLKLAPDRIKDKVGAYLPGSYVGQERGRWVWYIVEDYGEVVPMADSDSAIPVLEVMAAFDRMEQQNISSRLAQFIVPIDPSYADN